MRRKFCFDLDLLARMSLYDSGEIDTKSSTDWSSSIKLLQSQLQLKKTALTQAKQQKERQSGKGVMTPVVDLSRQGLNSDPDHDIAPPPQLSFNQTGNQNIFDDDVGRARQAPCDDVLDIPNEYDPLWPHDYEKIIKERREERERQREMESRDRRRRERMERHQRMMSAETGRPPRESREFSRRRDEEEEYDRQPSRKGTAGAAIAPPASLMEDVKPVKLEEDERPGSNFAPTLGGSVAAKIMAKYGFKEGQGLGKAEQGMSQALQVEKTSKRGGKIIHEKDVPKAPSIFSPLPSAETDSMEPPRGQGESITVAMRNPSKVVLLRNMVGPGEVDDDLEPETAEECTKYGRVVKCLIFEIPDNPDDEAVRIFIEFDRVEAAIKAVVDLNGRYFGGRVVKAGFYNLDKFRTLQLGD